MLLKDCILRTGKLSLSCSRENWNRPRESLSLQLHISPGDSTLVPQWQKATCHLVLATDHSQGPFTTRSCSGRWDVLDRNTGCHCHMCLRLLMTGTLRTQAPRPGGTPLTCRFPVGNLSQLPSAACWVWVRIPVFHGQVLRLGFDWNGWDQGGSPVVSGWETAGRSH